MLTRRRFAHGLMGLVVLAFNRSTGAIAAADDTRVTAADASLEGSPSREAFRALVREEFSLLLDNRSASLVLLRVEDGSRPGGEQFTVVFQGPRELVLLDGVYRIAHATAGTTEVFLQPAGHDNRYNFYKALFNLSRDRVPLAPPTRDRGRGWRFVP
jgi:hypothetical protein